MMNEEEVVSLLKRAIDNILKELDEFDNELPKYLRNEMLHQEEAERKHEKGKERE